MNCPIRHYTLVDRLLIQVEQAARTLLHTPPVAPRPNPAQELAPTQLTPPQRRLAQGLMRINHTGEVCAQALYQGQSFSSGNPQLAQILAEAAAEESDHLHWCYQRLEELGTHSSYLDPLWYSGALALGLIAGCCRDSWNLGFLMATEQQVSVHLAQHLAQLPTADIKSRAIVQQMWHDEQAHANLALEQGAVVLPTVVQYAMRLSAKGMTTLTYYV
jgi:ubiquinone biosynthesis monooxygenase Coq7